MTLRSKKSGNHDGQGEEQQVVDFHQMREKRLAEKRRNTERIFFRNQLGVFSVIGQSKIRPIELIDISEEGCSFQVPHDPNNVWPKDSKELPIRLYFSQDTYLEIRVTIQYSRDYIEDTTRYIRYGCAVDTTLKSYPAYQQFVRFLKQYSEHAHKDLGNASAFYL